MVTLYANIGLWDDILCCTFLNLVDSSIDVRLCFIVFHCVANCWNMLTVDFVDKLRTLLMCRVICCLLYVVDVNRSFLMCSVIC